MPTHPEEKEPGQLRESTHPAAGATTAQAPAPEKLPN